MIVYDPSFHSLLLTYRGMESNTYYAKQTSVRYNFPCYILHLMTTVDVSYTINCLIADVCF